MNQLIADAVLAELSIGKSLREACRLVDGAKVPTVLLWVDQHKEFAEQYAQARARGYQLLADELLSIADDGSNDTYMTDNGPTTNQDVIARSRLRVDTRKWMLSKMLPKVYGDKIDHEHSGTVKLEHVEWSVVEAKP